MFFFALFCFSLISVLVAMLGSKVSCFGVSIFLIWVLYAWCLFSVVLCMCSLSKEATDVPKERRHKKGLENTKAWRPARPVQQHTARAGWMLPSHTKNREFARPVVQVGTARAIRSEAELFLKKIWELHGLCRIGTARAECANRIPYFVFSYAFWIRRGIVGILVWGFYLDYLNWGKRRRKGLFAKLGKKITLKKIEETREFTTGRFKVTNHWRSSFENSL